MHRCHNIKGRYFNSLPIKLINIGIITSTISASLEVYKWQRPFLSCLYTDGRALGMVQSMFHHQIPVKGDVLARLPNIESLPRIDSHEAWVRACSISPYWQQFCIHHCKMSSRLNSIWSSLLNTNRISYHILKSILCFSWIKQVFLILSPKSTQYLQGFWHTKYINGTKGLKKGNEFLRQS